MSNNLRELRKAQRLSQLDLAKYMNVQQSTISNWESERTEIDVESITKLAKLFHVSIDYLLGHTEVPLPNGAQPISGEFIALPVIGTITAGYGGIAQEEYTGEQLEIPREILAHYSPDELYVLTIKGNSMYPELLDGDRVLVYRVPSVDSGTVAVVLYNGDAATVKRVEYEQGKDYIDLVPRNPEYQTKRIKGSDLEQCRILGKVIYLFRKF